MKYRKSKVVCVLGFMPKARLVRPFFKIFTCDMPGLGSNTLGVKNTRQRRQSLDAWSLLTSFKVWKPASAAPGQSSLCHAIFVQRFWRVFQVGAAIVHCLSSVAQEVMPKALEKKSSLNVFAELYNQECEAPTFFLRRVWSSWISFFQSCSRCSMSARSLPHAACYINRHSIDFNLWYTITIRYHSSSVSPISLLMHHAWDHLVLTSPPVAKIPALSQIRAVHPRYQSRPSSFHPRRRFVSIEPGLRDKCVLLNRINPWPKTVVMVKPAVLGWLLRAN